MPKEENYTEAITQRFLLLKDEVIGEKLCKNLSAFAEAVGEYPQNFSLMEKGNRSPTLSQCAKACDAFGYNANWLLLGLAPKKLGKGLEAPIEKRVSDLEIQMRSIKRLLAKEKS